MLIFGQILIDLIILIFLGWLIRISGNRVKPEGTTANDFHLPEALVKEMREIAADLDENLKQKRALSQDMLTRLDQRIEQAEAYIGQIEKINEAYEHQLRKRVPHFSDKDQTRSLIQSLLSKGCSREEIARHLGVSLGEIELLIKLQPHTPD